MEPEEVPEQMLELAAFEFAQEWIGKTILALYITGRDEHEIGAIISGLVEAWEGWDENSQAHQKALDGLEQAEGWKGEISEHLFVNSVMRDLGNL